MFVFYCILRLSLYSFFLRAARSIAQLNLSACKLIHKREYLSHFRNFNLQHFQPMNGPFLEELYKKAGKKNWKLKKFSKKESAPWLAAVASAKKQLHAKSRVHPALFLLSVVGKELYEAAQALYTKPAKTKKAMKAMKVMKAMKK
mmetsp:Transcript_10910/g.11953  ORF Transcript_10910/g.11953 Transcript_10910/m.11953 type:complete len:145 (-) Transcript_10910:249-683(-)